MELFLFALLVWFFYYRRKRKQTRDKWSSLEKAKKRLAPEQAAYDKMLMALPKLAGDGSFSQQVVGEKAYAEALNNYAEYLKHYHPGEDVVWAIVELQPDNPHDSNAVRVEIGQATVGYIPRDQAPQFGSELKALGGRASCDAKFVFARQGQYHSLLLDVVRPLGLVRDLDLSQD